MHWSSAIPLVLAVLSTLLISRRRCVFKLGTYGRALVQPLLLMLWFVLLLAGQYWGSIVAMAWAAAAPLLVMAVIAMIRFKKCRGRSARWSYLDVLIVAGAVLVIVAYNGNDNLCHYAIVNTYLRGNVPPCSLNDPTAPLVYHTLFDAAAALVAHAFGILPETALDVVTIACVAASFATLQAISRMLFTSQRTQQMARLFFVFGFGPSVVAALWRRPIEAWISLYQGQTTRPFVESIFRRPMGLNFLLFLLTLAAVLPRIGSAHGRAHPRHALPLGWLIPIAFLIPQASEELIAISALLIATMWLSGAVSLSWCACIGAVELISMSLSPVIRAMLFGHGSAAAPELSLGWPTTLPSWTPEYVMDGLPVFSCEAAGRCLLEWGPWFAGSLLLCCRDPRRRLLVAVFLAGLVTACVVRLQHWIKADLDRFLFYGTSAGFLLVAVWLEKLESLRERGLINSAVLRIGGILFIVIPTILGPVTNAALQVSLAIAHRFELPRVPLEEGLKELLNAVGPRELVLTDEAHAQSLVLSGFIVAAPLASNPTGSVLIDQFTSYFQAHPQLDPKWYLLPAGDARLAGHRAIGAYGGLVLATK